MDSLEKPVLPAPDVDPDDDDDEGPLGWEPVAVGLAALIAAVLIGVPVMATLYGLVFPPDAPVPPSAQLREQTELGYGTDTRAYRSDESPCAVLAFYGAQGATCEVSATWCQNVTLETFPQEHANEPAGTCTREISFSGFIMRYTVSVSSGNFRNSNTEFTIERETLWSPGTP